MAIRIALAAGTLAATLLIGATSMASESAAVAADAEQAGDRLGAVGIGVRDLNASRDFYAAVLGLEVLRTYELGYINEVVMGFADAGGAVVVLMNWPDDTERRYDGNDVKLVFYVADPAGVIERIRERGGRIDREATPIDVLDGAVVGLGRDPDGYVIEVIER